MGPKKTSASTSPSKSKRVHQPAMFMNHEQSYLWVKGAEYIGTAAHYEPV